MQLILVQAPVRVHYQKYCTRSVSRGQIQHEAELSAIFALENTPSAVFPIVHERNWCFYWFIMLWFPLTHALLWECMYISYC